MLTSLRAFENTDAKIGNFVNEFETDLIEVDDFHCDFSIIDCEGLLGGTNPVGSCIQKLGRS